MRTVLNRRTVLAWMLLVGAFHGGAGLANAGKFNSVLKIGDAGPKWEKLPGVDGRAHSLADLADKDFVILFFTCNSCPVAVDYEDRIIAFCQRHAGPKSKVAMVAVNVNHVDEDRLPKMREKAEKKKFPFPYLFDESQKIARNYGANYTPEFFILDKSRNVVYMGGFDDNSNPEQVKHRYLEAALQSLLEGKKPAVEESAAIGCMVRYVRERRAKK